MKFELSEYHRGVTDADLIIDLQRVAKELSKKSLTHDDYLSIGKFGINTFVRRFGSWNKSLERAGLNIGHLQNISNEDLFKNLEQVWIQLGRQPKYGEIEKPLSRYSLGTYENRFGTWRKALEKFVLFINNEEKISSSESIKHLELSKRTHHKTKREVNLRLRFIIMRRDNFKCKNCGRSPATNQDIILHVDHILAWEKGGETVLENLQTLCSKCNIGKSTEPNTNEGA
jgi:hypothetical protein